VSSRYLSVYRSHGDRQVPRWLRGHRWQTVTSLCVLLAGTGVVVVPTAAASVSKTVVSLTFDNGNISQYTLGVQQALQPHGVNATFYVNSGSIGNSAKMSWSQLSALAAAGNDIGGKTVDGTSLTTLSTSQQISEICNDRQSLVSHGLSPDTFAYPGGAYNATIETEVQNCGYGNARTAGSLSPTGSTYAETLPPKIWLAMRAWAPSGQVTLSNLESLVSGAAANGGGWVPIVIAKVCSSTLDPNNYASCTSSAGWIDLGDLNTFLSWVQSAGNSGGAPAGATFGTMDGTAITADTIAPTTTISCNGSACSSSPASPYTSTVTVALSVTDLGSGLASTHYTTDGTTPTLSSPTYKGPFPLTGTATIQYASWDNAGNAETAHSLTIVVEQGTDTTPPTTTISCNGAPCKSSGYTAPVTVTLAATDNPGGWGVASTYYTTDGSTPTTSSTVYAGPFTVKQNATVKFFSTDLAGNAEQVDSQAISFTTVVSLTFDDGINNQYTLAFQHVLQPSNVNGTFYINSTGINQGPAAGAMTWAQLIALNNAGNEIGGHTLDESNLTTDTTQVATTEVCQDRQNLLSHGFYPTSFAYPFGAYNATAESIVQSCGYTSGRAAGGIDVSGPGAGPVYAEGLPPKDALATRTVYNAPTGNPPVAPMLTLANMETAITGAAQNGGGWIQLVFHQICSQTYDPNNYSACTGSWGPVELDTLNSLVTWLKSAGQPGGAPTGTVIETVSQIINGPDTQPPVTTLQCDGSPCQSSTYNGSTTVSLYATDPGSSGVAATYYTTDGSTPTTSSPTYIQPFTVNQTTTVKWFSVDNAGNVEPVHTQTVSVQPNTDPVIGAAGDIACDPSSVAFNGGQGTATDCRAAYTAQLLTGMDAVFATGDDQYTCGGLTAFQQSFGPTWGVKRSIMYPVPGNQDLETSGGTNCPSTPGAYYQQYFSTSGGWYGSPLPSVVNVDPNVNYYSFSLGTWHIIGLNTGQCEFEEEHGQQPTFCQAGSPMENWLKADLASNTASCTLVFMQDPRWASTESGSGGDSTYQQLWQDMYQAGVEVVLTGNDHWYERLAPLNASGAIDNTYGVREFVVGTGGAGLEQPGPQIAASQALNATTHGILKMVLHNGSFDWQFINDGESSFTDSGTSTCHAAPPA
jgi:peptidoglycan/xylan/chitin deacetylase (PgdA/CDA1 family)